MGEVGAVAKLVQYTIGLLADPLLATWRAKREVEANRIRAEGQAENMEILAVGEAKAELAGREVRELAEGSQGVAALIEVEIDRRVESVFQKRVDNLAQIVARAERALPPGQVPDVEPDMAWTSSFSEAAQHISDEDMQEMWAKVLAGEVARPGSTSLRTMSVLRNLDQPTAQKFKRLCSIAVSMSVPGVQDLDHRVVSLAGNAAHNSLRDYGLSFDVLNILNEHELIIADYNSWFDYRSCIATPRADGLGREVLLGFEYQGQLWALVPDGERDQNEEFKVSGVALTSAGRELSRVVELEAVPEYDEALRGYFTKQGLTIERIRQP